MSIVHEVAMEIVNVLHSEAFPEPTESTWKVSAEQFNRFHDYPAAVAALDGKHVECVCPYNSGSTYYNYKGFYSFVLLALVDANYRCIMYDLGAPGRSSDAGIFSTSEMKEYLEDHFKDFPPPVQLGNIGKVDYHILVDQGFRQTTRFIRPFNKVDAMRDARCAYFNYKMSRARRVVENFFGILSSRFRLLLTPIYSDPRHAKTITLAIMILHNLLVNEIGKDAVIERFGTGMYDEDDEDRPALPGNIAADAKRAREIVMRYFSSRDGVR
ncbi:transposase, IS4 family [Oesophagostomum dentatum]|uniref:Transposase, IS4 family n=1 Tax=Oesophagostomum dentatum TaxID=61180 RepID=A0A0B1S3D1_OESDE|nr:transposase, IS4 family [Oesophagostomum dentatum]